MLGKRWDAIGRAAIVAVQEVNEDDVADVFPFPKACKPWPEEGKDRQIIDRRRRNAREQRVTTGSSWMPNAAMISELYIPKGYKLRVSADDLRNTYHVVHGSWERARSTPVGYTYLLRLFKGGCSMDGG